MRELTPVEWLEQQADTYAAGLANPATALTLPAAPAHLAYPGTEQAPHTALTCTTIPVTEGIAHVALDGPIPEGLAYALDNLARTVQRNHGGAEAAQ